MQYGVTLPSDAPATEIVALGVAAEAAGWDGVFVWDGIEGNDPWVVLAAIAAQTARVKLGTMLTPLSRRRPWKLAQETATLDQLSGGRVILAVGLGAPETGFAKYGEATDRKARATLLDESLAILEGLWRGAAFSYEGERLAVTDVTFTPTPVQQPRIPIWVVGGWPRPKSMARVARYDGLLPLTFAPDGTMAPWTTDGTHGNSTPADIAAMRDYLVAAQSDGRPLDIIIEGALPADDPAAAQALIAPYAAAGATWWLENIWDAPRTAGGSAGMRQRVLAGPPARSE